MFYSKRKKNYSFPCFYWFGYFMESISLSKLTRTSYETFNGESDEIGKIQTKDVLARIHARMRSQFRRPLIIVAVLWLALNLTKKNEVNIRNNSEFFFPKAYIYIYIEDEEEKHTFTQEKNPKQQAVSWCEMEWYLWKDIFYIIHALYSDVVKLGDARLCLVTSV